ncbi:uncharacterized protein DDB_G0271670-like isoform X2 [Drosophila subpulchrella]|uniref:uncharacterized protein DDB_G0271670-like isoform X2 n=1 Tax=Drosophila subpulchrella TaxID=1486046 RepID=UPI0018A16650|nr:uncharacterized protein DDB_G0271670-like isoform X2 [Drosophila subpulchrella]XP_037725677.1 uncharacterized protein DDB_G0271670-like isoform X2 [Drosophila subpulchrella]
MTFYWWSHWFWITLILSVNLLSSHVHTYPSQEAESQPVRTTKLYQTTVTQTWGTATQSNIMDLTHRPTTSRPVVTPSYNGDPQLAQVDEVDQAMELQEEQLPLNDREQEQDEEQEQEQDEDREQEEADPDPDQDAAADTEEAAANEELAQFEFKRSADFTSEQLNNFTNFSSSTSTNGSSSSTTTTKPVAISSSSPATTTTTTTTTTTRTVAGSTTTPGSGGSASTSTVAGSAATPSTPKINTEWLSDELLAGAAGSAAGAGSGVTAEGEGEGEKAPFTLENANKEDELRRAESEHRSRKSKVLSAEYKHINRYINFSSDTKSLLTRSASAAPSVAGGVPGSGFYDGTIGDEGNISSEALAIQRTYFLDAGAISAICFTVFGVCCTVGTIGIVLYRRRYLNKPQALSEPDSSVYIDDSTMRFSLLILQDNSDEMYSLDNDSFLNSLEAMTIQNYWTDTVKHTKL